MRQTEKTKAARSNMAKLPPMAYVNVADESVICVVKRGALGYYKTDWPIGKTPRTRADVLSERNRRLKVTEAQASAMLNGSMFGWHVPAADPDHAANRKLS